LISSTFLAIARGFQSTDPKDKVYALLGMVHPAQAVTIQPDYLRTAREVFRNVAINDLIELRNLRMFVLRFLLCFESRAPRITFVVPRLVSCMRCSTLRQGVNIWK
jgi:hypothetical protein